MATVYFGVNVSDIEARWRDLDAEETQIAAVLLADADLKLHVRRPALQAAIASTDPAVHVDARLATVVVVDMVLRVMQNPDLYKSTTVSADGSAAVSYFGLEVLRPRVSVAPGDLDEIDRAMNSDGGVYKPVRSRITVNADYSA